MKRKILWCWLSFLLVGALVVSSCAKGTTSTTTSTATTSTATTSAAVEPQYGGTLNASIAMTGSDPTSFDAAKGDIWAYIYYDPITEKLLDGDFMKYGSRGDNSYNFLISASIPQQFLGPCLAVSWEVTPQQTVFHLRQGVMFPDTTGVMKSREMTADDVVFCFKRMQGTFMGGGPPWTNITSISSSDKYTVVVATKSYDPTILLTLGNGAYNGIYPPEFVTAGTDKWQNVCGTGPFMLSDYVSGSELTYVKNPVYWGTTTINGKSYKEPFIDKMIYPLIMDTSTLMAALRTAKIDWCYPVTPSYVKTLAQSSPDLIIEKYLNSGCLQVDFNNTSQYFKNRDVRRALMIGTDLKTIISSIYGDGELDNLSVMYKYPGIWTPIDQMPASTQELFTYDPVKAKQMLADAGFPNGFTVTIMYMSTKTTWGDAVAMLQTQWAKLGVTVISKAEEMVTGHNITSATKDWDASMSEFDCANGLASFQARTTTPNPPYNTGLYSDPYYDAQYALAASKTNIDDQNAILKALAIYYLDAVPVLPIGGQYLRDYWWPWVKNYNGEISTGSYDEQSLEAAMWIDQALKTKMGY